VTEEFVVLLPPHLSIEARSRLAAERAFEREVLALVAELLGLDPPPVDACHEEHRATGTWDWHIVRAWQAASVTIRAIARPIERAGTRHGEDIEFEAIGLPPPLRVSAFAMLDVRVGGSVRVVVGGCQPERLERARPLFGRHVAVILEALGARP
jgi:hypothetical protein